MVTLEEWGDWKSHEGSWGQVMTCVLIWVRLHRCIFSRNSSGCVLELDTLAGMLFFQKKVDFKKTSKERMNN